jgi:hypothetical protein
LSAQRRAHCGSDCGCADYFEAGGTKDDEVVRIGFADVGAPHCVSRNKEQARLNGCS